MAKVKARCPVCNDLLEWEQSNEYVMWGSIPISDIGCVETTRPYILEVDKHLQAHREDGSFNEAWKQRKVETVRNNFEMLLIKFQNG